MKKDPKPQAKDDQQEQIKKLTEIAARAQADLQNFKSRMEKETAEFRKFAGAPILLALLPIHDDLSRASEHGDEGSAQILVKLDKILVDIGLVKMDPMGKPVDPNKHEVVNTCPGEKDIVTNIHEEGFEYHGRVLRPAKVQVGMGL